MATYTVRAIQVAGNCDGTRNYAFAVGNCSNIIFSNVSINDAIANVPYTLNLSVTGNSGTISYAITPSLPIGLSLNTATGWISGTPTLSTIAIAYVITATQSLGNCTRTRNFTFAVTCPSVSFIITSASSTLINYPYTLNAGAVGNSVPLTYSITPNLPTGLNLNTATGLISGTPTVATLDVSYTVTATQNLGIICATSKIYTFAVNACPVIYLNSVAATNAFVSTTYTLNVSADTYTLGAVGAVLPLIYTVLPALPAGLSLNATTGLISGIPTIAATTYTVTATQNIGVCFGRKTYTFAVNGCPTIVFNATPANNVVLNTVYNLNVSAVGNIAPLTYSVAPSLPFGLSLNATTGIISGTATMPTPATTYTVTATQNSGNCVTTKNYNFAVTTFNLTEDINLVWAKNMSTVNGTTTVDVNGNVYATGGFGGTVDFDPNVGVVNLTSNPCWWCGSAIFVSK